MLNPSRHQVLIVDDDDAVRDSLSLLLKASGFEVSTAADGLEALAVLRNGLPAVLLSDLNMPKMSGVELFSEVRQQFPSVSLVAMSGNYETRDQVPGGMIADAYYAKGYGSPGVLLRILSEMLSQSESRVN
jgi:two-component system response regulator MprA